MFKKSLFLSLCLIFSTALSATTVKSQAWKLHEKMMTGINYGNVLEAKPPEGWGLKMKEKDFKIIARAGFDMVRIPVRFNARAMESAPYTLDASFLYKVDRAVKAALQAGLVVIVDFHHYEGMFEDPSRHKTRFLAIWRQVAEHFKGYPDELIFEILNEPHDNLKIDQWNRIYRQALRIIRAFHPTRPVIIGPADWGGAKGLHELTIPKGDPNLILTFHHYQPYKFTHQGAPWDKNAPPVGARYLASEEDLKEIRDQFEMAERAAKKHNLPVLMGEFGAISLARQEDRVRWTKTVSDLCREFNYSQAYWEFKAQQFGMYDEKKSQWTQPMLDAVLGPKSSKK